VSDQVEGRGSGEGIRRTHLAVERTYLAWIRSGLGALAVSLAVGRLIPSLTDASPLPFAVLGIGFGLLGLFFLVYGSYRSTEVNEAIDRGGFSPLDRWAVTLVAVCTALLAIATIVLVAVDL